VVQEDGVGWEGGSYWVRFVSRVKETLMVNLAPKETNLAPIQTNMTPRQTMLLCSALPSLLTVRIIPEFSK